MDATARAQFVRSYTKLLTGAWSDEAFASRLQANPGDVLAESGFDLPAGADVEIVRSTGGAGDLDEQVKLWEAGNTSGHYVLYVPEVPQIETAELDESELDAVAGGDDTYCCCCSPCCTCT